MRVKKERKPVHLICIDCGCNFTALTSKALRCEECRKETIRRNKARAQTRYRSTNYVSAKARKKSPHLSIGEVLRQMEIYNKENGTHLSYGQYVALKEKG